MSLSCQSSNSPCVPSVHVVNVNSQLCADPAANVVIMETPRLYTSSMPWIDTYGQSVATRTLAESTNVVPATVRVGAPGHSTVQSQRLITNASKSSALVSNTGFSNAPVRGTYVQSASAQTFSPPAPDHATHAPVGNTGYTVSASVVPPTTGPSYGLTPLVNPTQSYGNILTSPIPYGQGKNA